MKLEIQVARFSSVSLIVRFKQSMDYANLSSSGKSKITATIKACRNLCRYRAHQKEQIGDRESRDTAISFVWSVSKEIR
jgi:hypothetical protein